jgi:uncharacterized membrane protein YkvA (DUF1232 family)
MWTIKKEWDKIQNVRIYNFVHYREIFIKSEGRREKEMENDQYQKEMEAAGGNFSDEKFWEKLKKFAKKAGSSVVYSVLLLYYTLQKPEVPTKTKAIIIGALGYFILPFDLIPDVAVGVGYTDDLAALGIALLQVAMYIDEDIKTKSKEKLKVWFGDHVDTSDIDAKL